MENYQSKQKQSPRGKTSSIGSVVQNLLHKMERQLADPEQEVFEAWEQAAGKPGRHAVPAKLREGVLYVEVDNGVMRFQLQNFEEGRIKDAINRRLGREVLKKIVFKNTGG